MSTNYEPYSQNTKGLKEVLIDLKEHCLAGLSILLLDLVRLHLKMFHKVMQFMHVRVTDKSARHLTMARSIKLLV